LFGYIFVDYNRNLHWFSPKLAKEWEQDNCLDSYYLKEDNYPKSKQKVLGQFFKDCHRCIQQTGTGLGEWINIGPKDKKEELVPFTDDSQSLFILDWRKYTKPEVVKKIEDDYALRLKSSKLDVDKMSYYYEIKDSSKILFNDKIIAAIEERFATPISYIRDLYGAHPYIQLNELSWWESGRHFRFDTSENNCVIWEGRPRWVSNNLDDVKITTSDDRKKIYCTFEDETIYKEQNYFDYRTQEERSCVLTYSADNNELVNYKVFSSKTKLCDRRYYDY
jgi:hypothetical protein